jgi:hypothetical protein
MILGKIYEPASGRQHWTWSDAPGQPARIVTQDEAQHLLDPRPAGYRSREAHWWLTARHPMLPAIVSTDGKRFVPLTADEAPLRWSDTLQVVTF